MLPKFLEIHEVIFLDDSPVLVVKLRIPAIYFDVDGHVTFRLERLTRLEEALFSPNECLVYSAVQIYEAS